MLLTSLLFAVFVGDGFVLQIDPVALEQVTPNQKLALTINGQETAYYTLAKRPVVDGTLWIGQGVDQPNLAVLGVMKGHRLFGVVRHYGTNWQVSGDAAEALLATEMDRVSEDDRNNAGRESPLSEQARAQLPDLIQPNEAQATRIDVLLVYNEALLASMSREEVTFALRVNLSFTNFILENSGVPMTLFPVGFLPVPVTHEVRPGDASRECNGLTDALPELKQWRYQFRPDITYLRLGCGTAEITPCNGQYLEDPIAFARSIFSKFGASSNYWILNSVGFLVAGAPNHLSHTEGVTLGTIMSKAEHLLPFLSGSPAAKRVFSSYHNNYFAVDQYRTKLKRHRLRKVTADNLTALLPLWPEMTLVDYVKGVGVPATEPDRILPPGPLRDQLLGEGWDLNQDGALTDDEIDNIDAFAVRFDSTEAIDGLSLLTSLRYLAIDFSGLGDTPLSIFGELDCLNLYGASDSELILENDTLRVAYIYDDNEQTFLRFGRCPSLVDLDIEGQSLDLSGGELPWLSHLKLSASTAIYLSNGEPFFAPRLHRLWVLKHSFIETMTPRLSRLDLTGQHWLSLVRVNVDIDPVMVDLPAELSTLYFQGDGSGNLPSLPANNALSTLSLQDVDAEGLQAWTLPNLKELSLLRAGLSALPELPSDLVVRLTLRENRLTNLIPPAGYDQLEYLHLGNNDLDAGHCSALKVLEGLIPSVIYQDQDGRILECPD